MDEPFKDRLTKLRERSGLEIPDMVKLTGLPDTTYRNYENGQSTDPTLSRAISIADALNVSLDELAGRELKESPASELARKRGERFLRSTPPSVEMGGGPAVAIEREIYVGRFRFGTLKIPAFLCFRPEGEPPDFGGYEDPNGD